MKKIIQILSVLMFAAYSMQAQPSGSILSNAGQNSSAGNSFALTWTLGEVIAGEETGNDIRISSGFLGQTEEETTLQVPDFLEKFESFKIGPNPTNGSINFQFTSQHAFELHLVLREISGKTVVESKGLIVPGLLYEREFEVHDLNAGTYFLEVSDGHHKVIKKVIKY